MMRREISSTTKRVELNDSDYISSLKSLTRFECARIADDTLMKLKNGWYRSSEGSQISLAEDVTFSIEKSILYTENDLNDSKRLIQTTDEIVLTSVASTASSYPNIEVRHCTTLQAAQCLVDELGEDRVGVLNFASAKNPGGGFLKGSNAQEESLARSSSLYSSLIQPRIYNGFYDYNRRGERGLYSHRLIYTPRVTIIKDDNGDLLSSPYHVNIVTIPAPNASVVHRRQIVKDTMMERIRRLLYTFEINQHDALVLGAFGCGVFKNDPFEVATIFRQHLESDRFKNSFKHIIFAIYNFDMYQVFKQVFTENIFKDMQHHAMGTSLDRDTKAINKYDDQQQQSNSRAD